MTRGGRRTGGISALAALSLAALLAACSSQASPSVSASAAVATSPPSAAAPSVPASSAPDAGASASRPPATVRPTAWSEPKRVAPLEGCTSVTEAIDASGTLHLASDCEDDQIRVASSGDGVHWTSRTFRPPSGRMLIGPQIAFDGNRLTLAYTRLAPAPQDEGCGGTFPVDVGVYLRTRSLPDGSWSSEQKLGETADGLTALRTADGLHALIVDKAGRMFYETLANGRLARHRIPGAIGAASLRIGDDGRPRVAFEAEDGIRLATFDGSAFRSQLIPGSATGWDPVLVLGPGNVSYVLWNRAYHGGGCTEPGPDPKDGTYFATDAGGSWSVSRLSPRVGGTSLIVDPDSGELNALVADFGSLTAFTRPAGGDWAEKTLVAGEASSPAIRQDPTTGDLVAAFAGESGISTIWRT